MNSTSAVDVSIHAVFAPFSGTASLANVSEGLSNAKANEKPMDLFINRLGNTIIPFIKELKRSETLRDNLAPFVPRSSTGRANQIKCFENR